jgi:hypothetical protein
MDEIAQIQRFGWEWRPDGVGGGTGPGVLVRVVAGGRTLAVFVPLGRVWVNFDTELQRVGCPSSQSVGAPFSVGGFFSFVKKAVSSVAKKVVPKAIQRAAAKVVSVAKHTAQRAVRAGVSIGKFAKNVSQNPVFRGALIAASFAVPALAPAAAALEIANRAQQMYARGIEAAKAIKAGANTAANLAAVKNGLAAKAGLQGIIQKAKAGDPRARQVVGAFQAGLVNQERHLPGGAQALQHANAAMRTLGIRF